MLWLVLLSINFINAERKVWFLEEFKGDEWERIWTKSEKVNETGNIFHRGLAEFHGDPEIDKGLQTTVDNQLYAISAHFQVFSNYNKTLVIQYTLKLPANIECGGGYIKLFPVSLIPRKLDSTSSYLMLFGPDICGSDNKKIKLSFQYNNRYFEIKRNLTCPDDWRIHLYTFILHPNLTYVIKLDNEIFHEGDVEEDFDFGIPKTIPDETATIPTDWDERITIPDVNHTKPNTWDDRELIPDPEATKPKDWNNEMDGEWEPPMITNVHYMGKWKQDYIPNPKYIGKWNPPRLPNPNYKRDPDLLVYQEIGAIGFELFQYRAGTIFDNILITNDVDYAYEHGENIWRKSRKGEDEMKKKYEENEKREEEERKKQQEEENEKRAKRRSRNRFRSYEEDYYEDEYYDNLEEDYYGNDLSPEEISEMKRIKQIEKLRSKIPENEEDEQVEEIFEDDIDDDNGQVKNMENKVENKYVKPKKPLKSIETKPQNKNKIGAQARANKLNKINGQRFRDPKLRRRRRHLRRRRHGQREELRKK